MNRDPIAEKGGLNLYGFCGNDGINGIDYLGYSWLSKTLRKFTNWVNKVVGKLERWLGKRTNSTVHIGGGDGAQIGVNTSGNVSFNGNPIGGNSGSGGSTLRDGGNGVLVDTTTGKGYLAGSSAPGYITASAPGFEAAYGRLQTQYGGQWWLALDRSNDRDVYWYALGAGARMAQDQIKQFAIDQAVGAATGVVVGRVVSVAAPVVRSFFAESVTPLSLLEAGARTPRVSVLGTYAPFNGTTYYELAEGIGARRFYLTPERFAAMTRRAEFIYGDPRYYNRLYLDSILKRQDIVRLNIARPEMEAILRANPKAFPTLRWEIDYLLDRGYQWADDLTSLIPTP